MRLHRRKTSKRASDWTTPSNVVFTLFPSAIILPRKLFHAISFLLSTSISDEKICPRNLCTVDEFPTRVSTSYIAFARNWMSASKVARDISREKIISLPSGLSPLDSLVPWNAEFRCCTRSFLIFLFSPRLRGIIFICKLSFKQGSDSSESRVRSGDKEAKRQVLSILRHGRELSRSAFDARCQSEITRQRIDVDW